MIFSIDKNKNELKIGDKGNLFLIRYYTPKADNITNKLLVIGFLRKFFKFKYFYYFDIK